MELVILNDKIEKKRRRIAAASLRYYYANIETSAKKQKLWREKNKDYIRIKQKESKRERKLRAITYLGNICLDCGIKHHPAIFEFHHRNPQEKDGRDPSKMLNLSWKRLSNELDKCDLLCANCHRLRHHKDNYGTEPI